MKYLKIKTALPTNTGDDITVPSGAVCKISEIYAPAKDADVDNAFTWQFPLLVYSSQKSLGDKKKVINDLLQETTFPLIVSVKIPYADFSGNKGPENVFSNAIKAELEKVVGAGNVDIINV